MSYHAEIERAIEHVEANAPKLSDFADWPTSEHGPLSSPTSKFAKLYELSDQDRVNFIQTCDKKPNEVFAKATQWDEFNKLLRTYDEIMGWRTDPVYVHDAYRHESEHIIAARHLGATGCKMGIALHILPQRDGKSLGHAVQPFASYGAFTTTKLGAALMCSYPEEPSAGDIQDYQAMGYESVEHIAEKLIRQSKKPQHPLPLSFDLSTTPRTLRLRRELQLRLFDR